MGAFTSKLGDFFSNLFGDWDSAAVDAKKSDSGGCGVLDDAAKKAAALKAASTALASIKTAAETAVSYVSGLFAGLAAAASSSSAVVSAYGALERAATAASSKVVELVKQLLGSDAAADARSKFDRVAAMLRWGSSSSFAATVVASLDAACTAAAPASVRETLAALPGLASAAASNLAAAASIVADIKALVPFIPIVEKLLGVVIPTEVKAAIAVVAVAVGLYYSFWVAPAAGASATAARAMMMKAPGGGAAASQVILMSAFEANPALYFSLLRSAGLQAAAAAFGIH